MKLQLLFRALCFFALALLFAAPRVAWAQEAQNPDVARLHGLLEAHKFAEAETFLTGLLAAANDADERADLQSAIGGTHFVWAEWLEDKDDSEGALAHFLQAEKISTTLLETQGAAITSMRISALYIRTNRYQEALERLNQLLPIFRQLEDKEGEAQVLAGLGTIEGELANYKKAADYIGQALTLNRELKDRASESTNLNSMGVLFVNSGFYSDALRFFNEAWSISRETGDKRMEAEALSSMGGANRSLKKFSEALSFYSRALPIQREVGDRRGEATTLTNMGDMKYELKKNSEALALFLQALPLAREVADRRIESVVLNDLMYVYQELNQKEAAIAFGKQAVNVLQTIRRDNKGLNKDALERLNNHTEDTYQELARLLIGQGRAREAEEVLAMAQQQDFLGFVGRDVRGVRLEASSNEYNGAEKIVVAQQNARVESVAKLSAEVFLLSGLETPDAAQKARLTQARASLGTARAQLDAFFAAMPQRFARNAGDVAADRNELSTIVPLLREIGQQTGGKVALVSALVDDKGLELLLTLPSGQTVNLSYAADAKQLNGQSFPVWLQAQITSFKSDILQRAPVENAATELWNVVGCQGALGAQLEGAQIDTVMWRLTGPLRALPLAALRDKDGYLVEKYRNVVLTAGSSELNLAHQPVGNWRALGVGVTKAWNVKGDQFSALTGVTSELKAVMDAPKDGFVGGVLPGRVLMDAEFSESNFFRLLRGATPESNAPWQVVHIASHFKLAGDRPQIVPADRRRTSADVGGELQRARPGRRPLFPGVELMTLSACDTAAGNGADNRWAPSLS